MAVDNEKVVDYDCVIVEDFMVGAVWHKAEKFFSSVRANEFDTYDINDVKRECETGMWQLWLIMNGDEVVGAFCTNIGEEASGNRNVNIFNLVGEGARNWTRIMDAKVTEFALQNGCKHYFTSARKGFLRYAPDLKEVGKIYAKKIAT